MEYLGCILPSNLGGSLSYTGDFNSPVVYSQIIISAARYGVLFFQGDFQLSKLSIIITTSFWTEVPLYKRLTVQIVVLIYELHWLLMDG